jgi:tight adherence protein B
VSGSAALAAVAGALAVAGAWEAAAAVERAAFARAVGRLSAPLRAAGREGRAPTAPERRRLAAVGAATLLAAGWLLAGPLAGAACAAVGPWIAGRVVRARRERWRADLAAGAPACARAIADALAGGHAIRGAVAVAAGGRVGGAAEAELRRAARSLSLGEPTEVVLEGLRRRAADPAWDTIVAAILLQRDAGGDLARLLRATAAAQEEAARVEADARTASAQARFTARLVVLLPLGAALLAELASPGYVRELVGRPVTAVALGVALACQATAFALIRRIARPEPA